MTTRFARIRGAVSKRRSIAFNTLTGLLTDVAGIPLIILSGVIITRALGPEQRGEWALLLTVNFLLANVLSLGSVQALTVFAAKRYSSLKSIHTVAIAVSLLAALVSLLAYALFGQLVGATLLHGVEPHNILLAVLLVPLTLYANIWEGLATGLEEIVVLNLFKFLQLIFGLIIPALTLLVFDVGLSGLLMTWLGGVAFLAAARAAWLFRRARGGFSWDPSIIKRTASFGSQIYLSFILAVILGQADVFMLNSYRGNTEVGYYAVAMGLAMRVVLATGALSTAINARMSSGLADEVATMTARLIRCLLGPALLLAVFLSLLAPLIVEVLYGREYIPSIGPFILLLFAMIAKTATQFLSLYLVNQRERPNISSAINAASLLLGLLLLYLLVPPYGAVGAALALVITSVAQAGMYLWSFLRYTSLRMGEVLILRREDWAWLLSIGRLRRNAKVS